MMMKTLSRLRKATIKKLERKVKKLERRMPAMRILIKC